MGWGGPGQGPPLGCICPWRVCQVEPQAAVGEQGLLRLARALPRSPETWQSPGGWPRGPGSRRFRDSRGSSASGAKLAGGLEPQPILQEAWDEGCDGGGGVVSL